jgi:hypothetical protein
VDPLFAGVPCLRRVLNVRNVNGLSLASAASLQALWSASDPWSRTQGAVVRLM